MSMETALRSRLLDDDEVSAIVGTRVDWTVRPELADYPAVVLQIVSDPRPQHMEDFHSLRETRVQIDCFAMTYAVAADLREAVVSAIIASGTFYGTRFDRARINDVLDRGTNTETGFVHRQMIDASIWHGVSA